MQADFSVELTADDPTLAVPWTDPEGRWRYYDLRVHPEAISEVEEAQAFSELREFLQMLNSGASAFSTAKCDAWFSEEMTEEETIFAAACKFGSYVDVVFRSAEIQEVFADHEEFAASLVRLLKSAPEIPAACEAIVRRAHFAEVPDEVRAGHYLSLYVTGYGDEEVEARQAWGIALRLVANACLQVSARMA